MRKNELKSIKEIIENGDYTISHHSYGTCTAGYLVNFKLTVNNKEHENTFNRSVYFLGFSSRGWYVLKYEGVFYNNHYNDKYRKYDEEIEAVLFSKNNALLSKKIC